MSNINPQTEPSNLKRASGVESALHSLCLWLFSLALAAGAFKLIDLTSFSSYWYDHEDQNHKTALFVIAAWLTTGVAYGVFYFKFAKRLTPKFKLHLAWPIATLTLGGLTLLGSLIMVAITLIYNVDRTITLQFLPAVILSILIIYNYFLINFAKPNSRIRPKFVQQIYPIMLVLLMGTILVFAGQNYIGLKADANTKNKVSEIANKIANYKKTTGKLPNSLADIHESSTEVTYEILKYPFERRSILSDKSFELCANFRQKSRHDGYWDGRKAGIMYSGSIGPDSIENEEVGKYCFSLSIHTPTPLFE